MYLASLGSHRPGTPAMRQIGTKQDKITWSVVSNTVTHEALARAIQDQRQFKLWMVVPIEGELPVSPFICQKRFATGNQLFKMLPHFPIVIVLALGAQNVDCPCKSST